MPELIRRLKEWLNGAGYTLLQQCFGFIGLYALDGECCKNEDKLIPFIDGYFLI
jgi:hypothetical protein